MVRHLQIKNCKVLYVTFDMSGDCAEKCLVMNRDTEELHAIMLEIEADMKAIEGHQCVSHHPFLKIVYQGLSHSEHAKKSRNNLDKDLEHLTGVLDKLDELGEIMEEMLQTQDSVEVNPFFCFSDLDCNRRKLLFFARSKLRKV